MSATVTITVSGPVGSAKSALLGEIEILLKALGVPTRYADEAAALVEKNMTHADWTSAIEMYSPSVVLVEKIEHSVPPAKAEGMTTALEVCLEIVATYAARASEGKANSIRRNRNTWKAEAASECCDAIRAIVAQHAKGEAK